MAYGVILPDNRICSPFESVEQIRGLACFPVPAAMSNPGNWQLLTPREAHRETKFICDSTAEITGQIARWIES